MTDRDARRRLKALYRDDRLEHADVPAVGTPAYAALRARDRTRRQQALALLDAIAWPRAKDLYRVAWLLNHGDQPHEAQQAHRLAAQAAALGHADARWLSAASCDRAKMVVGEPQTYGTQFVPDGVRWRLWPVDPRTTDAERAALDVPTLAEQRRRARRMTRTQPQPPMHDAPAWLRRAIANPWDALIEVGLTPPKPAATAAPRTASAGSARSPASR